MKNKTILAVALSTAFLAACGGGGGGVDAPSTTTVDVKLVVACESKFKRFF